MKSLSQFFVRQGEFGFRRVSRYGFTEIDRTVEGKTIVRYYDVEIHVQRGLDILDR